MTQKAKKIFNTAADVIANPLFNENVESIISHLHSSRLKRNTTSDGKQYKRNWYDRMNERGHVTREYFVANIVLIWAKKSKLPRAERDVIQLVCGEALVKTINTIAAEQANQPTG